MNDDEMREVYALWNKDEPNGHLAEITSHVFSKSDGKTGRRQIDKILAGVKQKARNIQLLENSGHRRWRHAGEGAGHQPRVEFPSRPKLKEKL